MNEAMHDYKKALEDLAKAILPEGDEAAIQSLDDGLDKIEKSLKELEKGHYDKASELYMEGQADFDAAASMLGY
jgi:prefoldin subunit 5